MAPNFLTSTENATLKRLESEIKAGQKTFVQVGLALSEIRDSKLYRGEFKTFDEYCQTRWGWKRQRAYELIQAAEVQSTLPVECNNIITNDSQARELAQVPAAARADVLKEVAAAGPVTAKAIKKAAKRNAEPEEDRPRIVCGPPKPDPTPEQAKAQRDAENLAAFGEWAVELAAIDLALEDLKTIRDAIRSGEIESEQLRAAGANLEVTARKFKTRAKAMTAE
jgi:hypothetical protein